MANQVDRIETTIRHATHWPTAPTPPPALELGLRLGYGGVYFTSRLRLGHALLRPDPAELDAYVKWPRDTCGQ